MNNLNLDRYLVQEKQTGARSERDELVGKFVDRINKERVGTSYKQVDARWFNSFLKFKTGRTMGNSELYSFYKLCESYDGAFSKIFFGSFKEQAWRQ